MYATSSPDESIIGQESECFTLPPPPPPLDAVRRRAGDGEKILKEKMKERRNREYPGIRQAEEEPRKREQW
jgi:hypothetical protein